jgi:uncharacterized ferritin-like protein (DUF455 family)
MTLREQALALLLITQAHEKASRTRVWRTDAEIGAEAVLVEPTGVPGQPAKPVLVGHTQIKRGSLATREGHAALLHSVAHIEINAINLALDAVWRFPGRGLALPAAA